MLLIWCIVDVAREPAVFFMSMNAPTCLAMNKSVHNKKYLIDNDDGFLRWYSCVPVPDSAS